MYAQKGLRMQRMKREQSGLKRRISVPLVKAGDHDTLEARKKMSQEDGNRYYGKCH